jgi:phosphate/phosphite/phosphonate ABC transporter binding protein
MKPAPVEQEPRKKLVFAIAWQGGAEPIDADFTKLTTWLSAHSKLTITPRTALSYVELGRMVRTGESDLAWLPPLTFMQLEKEGEVAHLVKNQRAGNASYHAALIVRSDSPIRSLDNMRGARVAWVDRWSAAGYVIPRAALTAKGFAPKDLFREERFYGSHEAVVNAVLSGRANVGATYTQLDEGGKIVRGAWSNLPNGEGAIRVLVTVGKIPGDVIATRKSLGEAERAALKAAFLDVFADKEAAPVARRIFGVEAFSDGPLESYDVLRKALDDD